MIKLLLNHLLIQKKRNFTWSSFFLAIYFYCVFFGVCVYLALTFDTKYFTNISTTQQTIILSVICCGIMVFDIVIKLLLSDNPSIMPSYIKTRPISNYTWNKFIITSLFLDFFTYSWVLPLAIVSYLLFDPLLASMYSLQFLLISLTTSVISTSFKKTTKVSIRFSILALWLIWFIISIGVTIASLFIPPVIFIFSFCILDIIAFFLFSLYMNEIHGYNEINSKEKGFNIFSFHSKYAIELRPFFRTPILKKCSIVGLLFPIYTYIEIIINDGNIPKPILCYVVISIVFMPAIYLQYSLNVIISYIDGIWTKPLSIKRILSIQYKISILLSTILTIIMFPIYFISSTPVAMLLLSCWMLSIGYCNVLCLLFIFITKPFNLFEKSMFKQQNNKITTKTLALGSLVLFIPLLIYFILPDIYVYILFILLGIIGLSLHNNVISKISQYYYIKRHKYFETYRK